MKNLILILSTVVAVLFSSCTKNENPTKYGVINLNLKINYPEVDTKAAKTGWEVGDKLNIWFDNNFASDHENPDLIITCESTSPLTWTAGSLRSGVTLKPTGVMYLLYEGHNDIGSYGYVDMGDIFYIVPGARSVYGESATTYCGNLVVAADNGGSGFTYNYSTETNTLSTPSPVSSWKTLTKFKVLIKGLSSANSSKYQLKVHNETHTGTDQEFPSGMQNIQLVYGEGFNFGGGMANGWTGGVADDEGVAFYYYRFACTNPSTITFTLCEYNNDDSYRGKKTCSLSGKSIDATINKCKGVFLNYTQFGDYE
ncbi:MAG: hypothetical protein J5604_04550 [Bacteroidales bacterium]|nr:hypothetical protein [Bacteroidales bacterium]